MKDKIKNRGKLSDQLLEKAAGGISSLNVKGAVNSTGEVSIDDQSKKVQSIVENTNTKKVGFKVKLGI